MSERSRHTPICPEIIRGCQKGDPQAQQAFYEHYGKLVMSACLRYAATDADAEDLFQESFIAVFEQISSLKKPGSIVSWLYKIIVSKVVRYYRKRVKMVEATEWNIQQSGGHREEEVIQALSTQEILLLVRELPDGYRLVFNLYVMEGFSHGEIAELTGMKEASSRSQLFKAKQWLKKKIVETYGITSYEKRIG